MPETSPIAAAHRGALRVSHYVGKVLHIIQMEILQQNLTTHNIINHYSDFSIIILRGGL